MGLPGTDCWEFLKCCFPQVGIERGPVLYGVFVGVDAVSEL